MKLDETKIIRHGNAELELNRLWALLQKAMARDGYKWEPGAEGYEMQTAVPYFTETDRLFAAYRNYRKAAEDCGCSWRRGDDGAHIVYHWKREVA